jgi:hypothetical protein
MSSSSDLSSDSDFEDIDSCLIDKVATYQIQHVENEMYKFSLVGYFKKDSDIINVELTSFDHEEYYCSIFNNFNKIPEKVLVDGAYLYDLITMNVLKKDGISYKVILSVEIENPDLKKENKGNLMIWFETNHKEFKRVPLKTGLTHPGNERLPYYIINELKNDKIKELLAKE